MGVQPVTSQKGEVEFRRKLVEQQVDGKDIFIDEYDREGIQQILAGRMDGTLKDMRALAAAETVMSPFLEIGAERGQRSLVMANEIGASGAALDISFDMLRSCAYYQKVFNKPNLPHRVCADANLLPFKSASLPFVFCYETLHHFPDPAPIVNEIHRCLLPGGQLFFAEEPYKRVFHLSLYKAKKSYSKERLNSSVIRKTLDYFFAEESCNEVDHDIIENHDVTIRRWKKALQPFPEKEVTLRRGKKVSCELFGRKPFWNFLLAYLVGGEISGICRKKGQIGRRATSILDALACPSCRMTGRDSALTLKDSYYLCQQCHKGFPIVDGVAFLFTHEKLAALYPEIFQNTMRNHK